MCDGRFAANSEDCGKVGADDLAASDDLAAVGNRSRQKKFYHTRGCLFTGSPIDTLPSRSRGKFCQWSHAVESEGGRPWNMPEPLPFARVVCPVMIVMFVRCIEQRKFCNMCVWEGGRQPVRLTT